MGPTEGPLRVSDRSKCYQTLSKLPRKSLTLRFLQTCQGSGVSSILIGRSIKSTSYSDSSGFPDHFPFEAFPPCTQPWRTPPERPSAGSLPCTAWSSWRRYAPSADALPLGTPSVSHRRLQPLRRARMPAFGKPTASAAGCRPIPQHRADAEGVTVFVGEEQGVAGSLASRKGPQLPASRSRAACRGYPELVLEAIDIHNRHIPRDAATGLADGISTYACGVGRAT